MQCELCGKDCYECKPAVVDGVKMMLCPGCMRHGEVVKGVVESPPHAQRPLLERIRRPRVKDDVYKKNVNSNKGKD